MGLQFSVPAFGKCVAQRDCLNRNELKIDHKNLPEFGLWLDQKRQQSKHVSYLSLVLYPITCCLSFWTNFTDYYRLPLTPTYYDHSDFFENNLATTSASSYDSYDFLSLPVCNVYCPANLCLYVSREKINIAIDLAPTAIHLYHFKTILVSCYYDNNNLLQSVDVA